MNAKTIFTALACITFSASAFALIGEDEKQIEARYGKPRQAFPTQGKFRDVGYAAHGFMLVITFGDGVSKREGFARPDKSALSSDAIQQILALTAVEGTKWQELPSKDGTHFWSRSDRKALAVFPAEGNFFFVQDPDFVQPQ